MSLRKEASPIATALAIAGLCLALLTPARAQAPGGSSGGPGNSGPNSAPGATTPAQAQTVEGAQQQLQGSNGVNLAAPTNQSFQGSLVEGTASASIFDLSLDDAIARGLRTNLGLILQTTAQQNARGQQYEQLQALLPTVTGDASIAVSYTHLDVYKRQPPRHLQQPDHPVPILRRHRQLRRPHNRVPYIRVVPAIVPQLRLHLPHNQHRRCLLYTSRCV